jgi:GT2 family glycosyltransferase
MYFEELDWCRRCRDMGWEIHYLSLAQIVHHHKASAGQIAATSRIRFNRSKIRYFRKYFGGGWAAVIRLFLMVNYGWILGVETAKWVVDHRREVHRQRMRDYWQVLKSVSW